MPYVKRYDDIIGEWGSLQRVLNEAEAPNPEVTRNFREWFYGYSHDAYKGQRFTATTYRSDSKGNDRPSGEYVTTTVRRSAYEITVLRKRGFITRYVVSLALFNKMSAEEYGRALYTKVSEALREGR